MMLAAGGKSESFSMGSSSCLDEEEGEEDHDTESTTTFTHSTHPNNRHHHSRSSRRKQRSSYDSDDDEERFVQRETRCVFLLRVVVILVLLCAGIAVSVVIYLITQGHQTANLQADYDAAASKVTDTFLDIALDKMGAAGSLVVATVAHGVDHTESWPFVTLSSFQQRSATVKQSSGALHVGIHPIVYHQDRLAWENYSVYGEYANWYQDGLSYQRGLGLDDLDEMPQVSSVDPNLDVSTGVANRIFTFVHNASSNEAIVNPQEERYLPAWEMSPVTKRTMVNQNTVSNSNAAITSLEKHAVVLEGMKYANPGFASSTDPATSEIAYLMSHANNGKRTKYEGDIFTNVYFPIYSDFTVSRRTVGVMRIVIHWARYFKNVLPSDTVGVQFVLDNSCDEPYTYMINGEDVVLVGHGDLHDSIFDDTVRRVSFQQAETIEDGTKHGLALFNGDCPYSIRVYQTKEFQNRYYTSTPVTITVSVAVVFFFTVLLFLVYDRLVERRQSLILRKATQTHDIVASLFPKNVRDRLLAENNEHGDGNGLVHNNSSRLKSFLHNGGKEAGYNGMDEKTIADLFPQCTVFFADISGFTAWSSSRDPAQVFVLLQNLYKAFDIVARRRQVFKVETIGDSYVAVTGLPEPQAQHAVIMCRFAADCLNETGVVTRSLETTLGPDTGELCIRIGLHSGPVTAGVLCGERSRFQLFGDTVNTAARMESTGVPGRIQASKATVDLLIAAGKEHWARTREDDVVAKGKGVLSTFWITPNARKGSSQASIGGGSGRDGCGGVGGFNDDLSGRGGGGGGRGELNGSSTGSNSSNNGDSGQDRVKENNNAVDADTEAFLKQERLVDWMVQMLQEQIVPIVRRHAAEQQASSKNKKSSSSSAAAAIEQHQNASLVVTEQPEQDPTGGQNKTTQHQKEQEHCMCSLDEVVEVIELPAFDAKKAASADRKSKKEGYLLTMDEGVKALLRTYVTMIASAYRDNPFHNFEHACHVTMNVVKFLKRIVSSEVDSEYTNGLNSDPIVVLAIVFSALVHDVDHRGISNEQLMKEEPNMAACFKHKSCAEQNSLQLSFSLLMTDQFKVIREYIFATPQELARFRQVLVNVVLATDIFDQELNAQRKARWTKAFAERPESSSCSSTGGAAGDADNGRRINSMRATIVMEHIIQASDVCHTMQHWHIYRRWNKRLFFELMVAKQNGRMGGAGDPADFWYKGEIAFFDNYVIPLAKKLEDCQVFGVSSHECLNYAIGNRNEWEARGLQIVEEMLEEFANSEWSSKVVIEQQPVGDQPTERVIEEEVEETTSKQQVVVAEQQQRHALIIAQHHQEEEESSCGSSVWSSSMQKSKSAERFV